MLRLIPKLLSVVLTSFARAVANCVMRRVLYTVGLHTVKCTVTPSVSTLDRCEHTSFVLRQLCVRAALPGLSRHMRGR